VGALKLFPHIRQWELENGESIDPKSSIVDRPSSIAASGAACRMQIKQGTGVEAMHPILLVAIQVQEWKSHGK